MYDTIIFKFIMIYDTVGFKELCKYACEHVNISFFSYTRKHV